MTRPERIIDATQGYRDADFVTWGYLQADVNILQFVDWQACLSFLHTGDKKILRQVLNRNVINLCLRNLSDHDVCEQLAWMIIQGRICVVRGEVKPEEKRGGGGSSSIDLDGEFIDEEFIEEDFNEDVVTAEQVRAPEEPEVSLMAEVDDLPDVELEVVVEDLPEVELSYGIEE